MQTHTSTIMKKNTLKMANYSIWYDKQVLFYITESNRICRLSSFSKDFFTVCVCVDFIVQFMLNVAQKPTHNASLTAERNYIGGECETVV